MKKHLCLALLLGLLLPLNAQESEFVIMEQAPTVGIAFQPLSLVYNAAEIDLDLRIRERQWLTLAPRIQFGNPTAERYFYEATDAIKNGYGLGLTYRYFPLTRGTRKLADGTGPFVSFELDYLNTSYSYIGSGQESYTDVFGNNGYTIVEQWYDESCSQVGVGLNLGYSLRMFDILYLEGFLGIGTKWSDYRYDATRGFNLGEYAYDTGYSGYCMTGGFRIGIFLNRYRYVSR